MTWSGNGRGLLGASAKNLTRIYTTNNKNNSRKALSVSAATQRAFLSSTSAVAPHKTTRTPRQHHSSSSSSSSSPPCTICYGPGVLERTARPITAPPRTRAFCAHSSEQSSGENGTFDVHVTHVDARKGVGETEAPGQGSDVGGHGAGVKDSGMEEGGGARSDEPVEVRFLDVPGSEETRAEKMTIVFTCTVGWIVWSWLGVLFLLLYGYLSVSCLVRCLLCAVLLYCTVLSSVVTGTLYLTVWGGFDREPRFGT